MHLVELVVNEIFSDTRQIEQRLNGILNSKLGVSQEVYGPKNFSQKVDYIQKNKNQLDTKDRNEWNKSFNDLNLIREIRNKNYHPDGYKVENMEPDYEARKFLKKFIKDKENNLFWKFNEIPDVDDQESIKNEKFIGFEEVPDYLSHRFWGRDRELDHIENQLLTSNVILVYGNGGLGKTALLDFFARERIFSKYEKIYWFSKKLQTLNMQDAKIESNLNQKTILNNLVALDENESNTLIILDNIDDYLDDAQNFVTDRLQNKNFNFILTSRIDPDWQEQIPYTRLHLNSLTPNDSALLIKNIAPFDEEIKNKSDKELEELAKKLNCSPLYIKLFMSQRGKRNTLGIDEFIAKNEKVHTDYIFQSVFKNTSSEAKFCLRLINSSPAPVELLMLKLVIRNADEDNNFDVKSAINELESAGLIRGKSLNLKNKKEKTYVVADYVKNLIKDNELQDKALLKDLQTELKIQKEISDTNVSIMRLIAESKEDPNFTRHEEYPLETTSDALVFNEIARIRKQRNKDIHNLKIKNKIEWEELSALQHKIIREEYEKKYNKFIETANADQLGSLRKLGDIVPDNYQVKFWLGLAFEPLNRFEEAVSYFESAYEIAVRQKNNFAKKQSLNRLALCYDKLKFFTKCAETFEKLRDLEPKHYRVTLDLAQAYRSAGNREKSIKLTEQSLDLMENDIKQKDFSEAKYTSDLKLLRATISSGIKFLREYIEYGEEKYLSREAYDLVFRLLNKMMRICAVVFDKINLKSFLVGTAFIMDKYQHFCREEGIKEESFESYRTSLIEIFEGTDKIQFLETIESFNPDAKNSKEFYVERKQKTPEQQKEDTLQRHNSKIMNAAYKNKQPVKGRVFHVNTRRGTATIALADTEVDYHATGVLDLKLLDTSSHRIKRGDELEVIVAHKTQVGWQLIPAIKHI